MKIEIVCSAGAFTRCLPLVRRTLPEPLLFLGLLSPKTRPEQTRPEQSRADQTRADQTRPDRTRPDCYRALAAVTPESAAAAPPTEAATGSQADPERQAAPIAAPPAPPPVSRHRRRNTAFAPRPLRLQRERGPAVWQRPRPGGGRAALPEAERRPGGGLGPSGGHRLAEGGDASNTLAAPLEGAGARLPPRPSRWPLQPARPPRQLEKDRGWSGARTGRKNACGCVPSPSYGTRCSPSTGRSYL